jgi:hypothetical protein
MRPANLPALPFPFARFFGCTLIAAFAETVDSILRFFFDLLEPSAVWPEETFDTMESVSMLFNYLC